MSTKHHPRQHRQSFQQAVSRQTKDKRKFRAPRHKENRNSKCKYFTQRSIPAPLKTKPHTSKKEGIRRLWDTPPFPDSRTHTATKIPPSTTPMPPTYVRRLLCSPAALSSITRPRRLRKPPTLSWSDVFKTRTDSPQRRIARGEVARSWGQQQWKHGLGEQNNKKIHVEPLRWQNEVTRIARRPTAHTDLTGTGNELRRLNPDSAVEPGGH